MGVAQDLAVESTHPSSGKTHLSAPSGDTMIGGAFLLDLVAQRQKALGIPGERVDVVDTAGRESLVHGVRSVLLTGHAADDRRRERGADDDRHRGERDERVVLTFSVGVGAGQ